MIVLQIVVVCIGLIIVTLLAGLYWIKEFKTWSKKEQCALAYSSGMITLWGIFQMIAVPYILLERTLSELINIYMLIAGGWIIFSILYYGMRRNKLEIVYSQNDDRKKTEKIGWWVFSIILFLQIILLIIMPFNDGDDAYYIAVATIAEQADSMYQTLPYSGGAIGEIDARHGLAPFPIWIAFLSRVTGVSVPTMAHIVVPIILLILYYCIMICLANLFIKDKMFQPLFLVIIQMLTIWGNYSLYSAETFLLTRTSQGKAVIANMILPFIIFVLYQLSENYLKKSTNKINVVRIKLWILLILSVFCACLCTSFGSVLAGMLIGICGVCMLMLHRKISIILGIFMALLPAMCYAILYILIK